MSVAFSLCFTSLFILSSLIGQCVTRRRPVGPQPSFVATKMNVTVSQGDIATLPCTVQNLGTRQVSWRRMGNEHFLTIGTHTWVQDPNLVLEHAEWPGAVTDWNLVVKEARLRDAGTYECQVIHTETIKWRVHLNVIAKQPVYRPGKTNQPAGRDQRFGHADDKAISLEGNEYVESGEAVYLVCNSTDGSRVPEDVDWFKDGNMVDSRRFPHIVITKIRAEKEKSLISELIIQRGKNTDSGTYVCRSSLEQIASLEVTVLVAESSNMKRGSGSSQTTRAPSRGENRAVTFTFVLGNPFTVTLLVALSSLLTFTFVTT